MTNSPRLQEIQRFTYSLLKKHGMHQTAVSFKKSVSWAGLYSSCVTQHSDPKKRSGVIYFSLQFMENMTYDQIKDTIYHEVGHALVGAEHGHDSVWAAEVKKLGGSSERTCTGEAISHLAKWKGVCRNGHESFAFRLTEKRKNRISCGQCADYYDPANRYIWTQLR